MQTSQVQTSYHMNHGIKMYTERYDAAFSVARKLPKASKGAGDAEMSS